MPLTIINPIEYPNWNELLLANKESSFFHTSNWAKVLCESYKYKPLYFTSIEDEKLTVLIPLMEINSIVTGRRAVSLPFTDFCKPIISEMANLENIINTVNEEGQTKRWNYIEYRGGEDIFQDKIPSSFYYIHTLDLTPGEQIVLKSFRSSTKRNIRKAVKNGVEVEILHSLESVKDFYRLNCITRRDHGLPPQPFYFFKKIFENIISENMSFVILASYHDQVIAGAIYFHFGNTAIYKYGASDKAYQHLRPNNLVMWEAIKWFSQNGIKTFSFGITEPNNFGLLQFKRGWGGTEHLLQNYKYNIAKACYEKNTFRDKVPSTFFRHLPSPLLNLIGYLSYRHIA